VLFIQISSFKKTFVGKNDPHIGVLAGFRGFIWVIYVAKTASVPLPLVGIGRGANLPYFGKQSDY
jgi:hypothetical protein